MSVRTINYWPWVITGIFVTVVVAIIITLYMSMLKPLEYDTYFNGDPAYVKANFPSIAKDSSDFNASYQLILPESLANGANIVRIALETVDAVPVDSAVITARLTRPATNTQDITLAALTYQDGVYVSAPFDLWAKGIWHLDVYIEVGGLKVFRRKTFEYPTEEQ